MKSFKLVTLLSVIYLATACKQAARFDSSVVTPASTSSNGDVLDDGVRNQKPKIHCELRRPGQLSSFKVLDTDYTLDKTLGEAQRGDDIAFDCSKTTDDQGASQLKFKFDFGNGLTLDNQGSSVSRVYSAVSEHTVSITATDALGASQVKTFTLIVQCQAADVTPIVISDSAISVSPGGKTSEFSYSINPAAISGGPVAGMADYSYSWDFNGDGYPDDYGTPASPYTSQTTASNVYMNFANSKDIGVLVYERNCRIYAKKYVPKTFAIPRLPANTPITSPFPNTPKPNFFVQGDIRPLTNPAARHESGDFIVQNRMDDPKEKHRVICSYRRGSELRVRGENWYGDRNASNEHGINLVIRNINDDGRSGRQVFDSYSSVKPQMYSANYFTPEVKDVMKRMNYTAGNANCQVDIAIERQSGVVLCSGGLQGTKEPVVLLEGKYRCDLTADDGSGRKVEIKEGYFYCEEGPVDQCYGGTGGSSGGFSPPKT